MHHRQDGSLRKQSNGATLGKFSVEHFRSLWGSELLIFRRRIWREGIRIGDSGLL
jgi:hypothetical protein